MLLSSIAPAHYRTTTALHAAVEAPMDTEVAGPASPTATQLLHTTNVSGSGPEALRPPRHLLLERLATLEDSTEKQALAQALSHLPMSALLETHPDFLTYIPKLIALLFPQLEVEHHAVILKKLTESPLDISISQFVVGTERILGHGANCSNDEMILGTKDPAKYLGETKPFSYSLDALLMGYRNPVLQSDSVQKTKELVQLLVDLDWLEESGNIYVDDIACHLADYYNFLENPTPAPPGFESVWAKGWEISPKWIERAIVQQVVRILNADLPNGDEVQRNDSGSSDVTSQMARELGHDLRVELLNSPTHSPLNDAWSGAVQLIEPFQELTEEDLALYLDGEGAAGMGSSLFADTPMEIDEPSSSDIGTGRALVSWDIEYQNQIDNLITGAFKPIDIFNAMKDFPDNAHTLKLAKYVCDIPINMVTTLHTHFDGNLESLAAKLFGDVPKRYMGNTVQLLPSSRDLSINQWAEHVQKVTTTKTSDRGQYVAIRGLLSYQSLQRYQARIRPLQGQDVSASDLELHSRELRRPRVKIYDNAFLERCATALVNYCTELAAGKILHPAVRRFHAMNPL
jgi:hypothetical protein